MNSILRRRIFFLAAFLVLAVVSYRVASTVRAGQSGVYDIVLARGRVMDPESGLDGIRYVGVRGNRIEAISEQSLTGTVTIDAAGMVIAPGLIDLHSHGQNDENYRYKARDGVTTALELEVGTADVPAWYAERE
jgi:N-acyl-D-aspartate/D-glutamate deacylase